MFRSSLLRASDVLETLRERKALQIYTVLFLFLVAFCVRILPTRAGLPYLHFYDEPYTSAVALNMMKSGDFNPHYFERGSLMIYLNLFVDVLHYFYLMGQPDNAPAYLRSLNEIKTSWDSIYHYTGSGWDTGWLWTISHPSFYLWNRWLSALLGTGCVVLTYLLLKEIAGPWCAIFTASLLAFLPYHVADSAIVYLDIPASFFILWTVYLSILYLKREKISYWIWSLVTAGLAASAKFNASIVLIVPLLALFHAMLTRKSIYRNWLWVTLFFIPAISFFVTAPYILLDMTKFLKDFGGQIYHYRVEGTQSINGFFETTEPGLNHVRLQMIRMGSNLGIVSSILVVLGIIPLLLRRTGWLILTFPVLYILLQSEMKISFHRNYIAVYPFALAAGGIGAVWLYTLIRERLKSHDLARAVFSLGFVSFLIIFSSQRLLATSADGWEVWNRVETRTQAIDLVNVLSQQLNWKTIGISEELRVHDQDLKRIETPMEVRPALHFFCGSPQKFDAFIIPMRYTAIWRKKSLRQAEIMNAFTPEGKFAELKGGMLYLDKFSSDPGIWILRNLETKQGFPEKKEIRFDDDEVIFSHFYEAENGFRWTQEEAMVTNFVFRPKSTGALLVLSTSPSHPAFEINAANLTVYVNHTIPTKLFKKDGGESYFRIEKAVPEIRCIRIRSKTFVPFELKMNRDTRTLGIMFRKMKFSEAPTN